MNKIAIITAFLGGVKNRYMTYQPERCLEDKLKLAADVEGVEGLELCYPADFTDPVLLKKLLSDHGFSVSAVNTRSRRQDKWLRGSFTSENPKERNEVVDEFKRAIDAAREVGCGRITTCPLNDGHDYPFEMNYLSAYGYAAETFAAICDHDTAARVCIEYKQNDPRTRCLLASAGETAAFCGLVGARNLGATLDFGHAILAGERPAQSAALLHKADRLFYVHLNDNDRAWDWDMLPGAFNLVELVEFFFYLREIGYDDDWYAFDVMSKEVDTVETFSAVVALTRKTEELSSRIDRTRMLDLMKSRNPVRSFRAMFEEVFR